MSNKQNKDASEKQILITGFGGQGIILAGRIIGTSAALGDKKESTFVQSYGPESRGGACCAQVIISNKIIHYPYIKHPDILVCMSQGGYDKFISQKKEEGILLIDQDLVHPKKRESNFFAIPATRIAEELGRKMMANIIMIGFLKAITDAISMDSAKNAIASLVPKGTENQNIKAFQKGCDYGFAILKGSKKKALGKTGVAT